MARLLPFLIIGFVVWWVWRTLKKRAEPPTHKTPTSADPTLMVACAKCGLHLPADNAVWRQQGEHTQYFCCADHARQTR
jgi:uncharacterized protein